MYQTVKDLRFYSREHLLPLCEKGSQRQLSTKLRMCYRGVSGPEQVLVEWQRRQLQERDRIERFRWEMERILYYLERAKHRRFRSDENKGKFEDRRRGNILLN